MSLSICIYCAFKIQVLGDAIASNIKGGEEGHNVAPSIYIAAGGATRPTFSPLVEKGNIWEM